MGDQLNVLDQAWGDAYDIGISDGKYYARRVDGSSEMLITETPRELNASILADWTRYLEGRNEYAPLQL